MKLNADDCRELRGDLDELLEAVRELQHELGNDNEEIKSDKERNRKKGRQRGRGNHKKNQANGFSHY